MVCVELTDGALERMIALDLNTFDGTALGKKYIMAIDNLTVS